MALQGASTSRVNYNDGLGLNLCVDVICFKESQFGNCLNGSNRKREWKEYDVLFWEVLEGELSKQMNHY